MAGIEQLRNPDDGSNDSNIPALLVSIGSPKLRSLGYSIPSAVQDPEAKLYDVMAHSGDGAHSRYNALVRRLVSFERAKACVNGQVRSIFANS